MARQPPSAAYPRDSSVVGGNWMHSYSTADLRRFLEPFSFQWHKSGVNEDQLITALKGQDPGAVSELVNVYGDRLLRSAFALCGNEADAQDIVQDTFLQAIRSVHRFQGRSTVYTWLHAILLNLTRHYHRDRERLVYGEGLTDQEAPLPETEPIQLVQL